MRRDDGTTASSKWDENDQESEVIQGKENEAKWGETKIRERGASWDKWGKLDKTDEGSFPLIFLSSFRTFSAFFFSNKARKTSTNHSHDNRPYRNNRLHKSCWQIHLPVLFRLLINRFGGFVQSRHRSDLDEFWPVSDHRAPTNATNTLQLAKNRATVDRRGFKFGCVVMESLQKVPKRTQ